MHSVAYTGRPHGNVCSCGLVMGELDPATAGGHLDTDTWDRTDLVVVAHQPDPREAGSFRRRLPRLRVGRAGPLRERTATPWVRRTTAPSESRPATPTALLRRHLGPA